MWQKVTKFKGAEYFRKALYTQDHYLLVEPDLETRVEGY